MALSNELKEALKAGKLTEALIRAMGRATELKITTWVSSESGKTPLVTEQVKPGSCLRSQINLLQSEINNEVGQQFVDNEDYKELLPFHNAQVVGGSSTIANNLRSLQQIFTLLVALQQQNPEVAETDSLAVQNQLLLFADALSTPSETLEPEPASLDTIPPTESTWEVSEAIEMPGEPIPQNLQLTEDISEPNLATPQPEMPVTDLEAEDWEDLSVGLAQQRRSHSNIEEQPDLLSLDDLEPEEDWEALEAAQLQAQMAQSEVSDVTPEAEVDLTLTEDIDEAQAEAELEPDLAASPETLHEETQAFTTPPTESLEAFDEQQWDESEAELDFQQEQALDSTPFAATPTESLEAFDEQQWDESEA
ncbi:MAG: hypothetical protein ACOC3E_02225, partial [Cyanobacteriota bacterium]